ncbi:MAG TPA: hypothetical protein V6C96_01565 [Vampirovibrionales bacterium]
MTAKEKAIELVEKMQVIHYTKLRSRPEHKGIPVSMHHDQVKQCALICVDEILNNYSEISKITHRAKSHEEYWQKVKEEIEKL